MHPTETIQTQAQALADTLEITAKEAEAYLHWYITGDETTHSDIANWMGISPSMVSRHLQNAKSYIETTDDIAKAHALRQFLIRTNTGKSLEKTHDILEANFEANVYAVITEQTLRSHSESYQIHLGQKHTMDNTEYIDNMPSSMTLPDTWSHTTITSSTLTELLQHTEYHLQNNATTNNDDIHLVVFYVFKNTPVSSDWISQKAINALQA